MKLALVCILATARVAMAQSPTPENRPVQPFDPNASEGGANVERAKQLYAEGSKRYDLREYNKAIDAFREAYELVPEPLLLFNMAQAYRQIGDCKNAVGFYRNYLVKKPDADNREQVNRFVADLEPCPAEPAPTPQLDVEVQPRSRTTIKVLRGAGIVLTLGGLAGGALAAYHANEAKQRADEIERECQHGCQAADVHALDQRGRESERTALWLSIGGGVALTAGVGLLLYVAFRAEPDSIIVKPAADGATVSRSWRF